MKSYGNSSFDGLIMPHISNVRENGTINLPKKEVLEIRPTPIPVLLIVFGIAMMNTVVWTAIAIQCTNDASLLFLIWLILWVAATFGLIMLHANAARD